MLNAGASVDLLLGVINRASGRWPPNLSSMLNGGGEPPSPGLLPDRPILSKRPAEAKLGGALTVCCITWTIEMGFAMKTTDRNSSSEIGDKPPSEVTR